MRSRRSRPSPRAWSWRAAAFAHHPAHGALWWVCAGFSPRPIRLPRPRGGRLLDADPTANRLAATLPLLEDDEIVAVVGWPNAVDDALAERIDLPAVAVALAGRRPGVRVAAPEHRTQRARWSTSGIRRSRTSPVSCARDRGSGRTRRWFPPASARSSTSSDVRREVWLVGGVGRSCPAALFDAAVSASADAELDTLREIDDPEPEPCALERFDRIVGPRGIEPPLVVAARVDCPVVPDCCGRGTEFRSHDGRARRSGTAAPSGSPTGTGQRCATSRRCASYAGPRCSPNTRTTAPDVRLARTRVVTAPTDPIDVDDRRPRGRASRTVVVRPAVVATDRRDPYAAFHDVADQCARSVGTARRARTRPR